MSEKSFLDRLQKQLSKDFSSLPPRNDMKSEMSTEPSVSSLWDKILFSSEAKRWHHAAKRFSTKLRWLRVR
jgi:hypothetical protein